MGYDMSTVFIIQIEMPAIQVCSQVSFDVRPSRLQDIFNGAKGLVKQIAEDHRADLIALDHEGTEQRLESLRRKALAGVNEWRDRLKMADDWKKKVDKASATMDSMREAYYKELCFLREQVYQKQKAEKEGRLFEATNAIHFDPHDFTMDEDVEKLVKRKVMLLTQELATKHDDIQSKLHDQASNLRQQLTTARMKLALKENLLEKHGLVDSPSARGDAEALRDQKQENADAVEAVRNFRGFLLQRYGSQGEAKTCVSQQFSLDADVGFANFRTICDELGYEGAAIKPLFVMLSGGATFAVLSHILDQAFALHKDEPSSDSGADHRRSQLRCIDNGDDKSQSSDTGATQSRVNRRSQRAASVHIGAALPAVPAALGGRKLSRWTMTLVSFDSGLGAAFSGVPGSYDHSTAHSSADHFCDKGTDVQPYESFFPRVQHVHRAAQCQIDARMLNKAIEFFETTGENNWNQLHGSDVEVDLSELHNDSDGACSSPVKGILTPANRGRSRTGSRGSMSGLSQLGGHQTPGTDGVEGSFFCRLKPESEVSADGGQSFSDAKLPQVEFPSSAVQGEEVAGTSPGSLSYSQSATAGAEAQCNASGEDRLPDNNLNTNPQVSELQQLIEELLPGLEWRQHQISQAGTGSPDSRPFASPLPNTRRRSGSKPESESLLAADELIQVRSCLQRIEQDDPAKGTQIRRLMELLSKVDGALERQPDVQTHQFQAPDALHHRQWQFDPFNPNQKLQQQQQLRNPPPLPQQSVRRSGSRAAPIRPAQASRCTSKESMDVRKLVQDHSQASRAEVCSMPPISVPHARRSAEPQPPTQSPPSKSEADLNMPVADSAEATDQQDGTGSWQVPRCNSRKQSPPVVYMGNTSSRSQFLRSKFRRATKNGALLQNNDDIDETTSPSRLHHCVMPLGQPKISGSLEDELFRDTPACLVHQRSRSRASRTVQQQHTQPRPQTSEPVPLLRAPSPRPSSQVSVSTSEVSPNLPAVSRYSGQEMTRSVVARASAGSRHGATLHPQGYSAEPGGTFSDLAGLQPSVSLTAPLNRRNSRHNTLRRPSEVSGVCDPSNTPRRCSVNVDKTLVTELVMPTGPQLTVTGAKASGPKKSHVADTKDHGNEDPHSSRMAMSVSGELSTDDEVAFGPRPATSDKAAKPDARFGGSLLPSARAAANGARKSLQVLSSRR